MRMRSRLAVGLILLGPVHIASADWGPCGGASDKLWAWAWAGESNENVVTNSGQLTGKQYLDWMGDLSGNGRHYYNDDTDALSKKPKFEIGVDISGSWGAFRTHYAPFDRNRWNDGSGSQGGYFNSNHTFSAPGEFYLAALLGNLRSGGTRDMWGVSSSNGLRLDQDNNRIRIRIGSTSNTNLTDVGKVPAGIVLLEVFRDSNNVVHVWANGVDVGLRPTVAGTFQSRGWGWFTSSSSHWDDYAFEIITCEGLPSAAMRAEVREYLQAKWGLDGSDGPPPPPPPPGPEPDPAPPNPPTEIRVD